MDLTFFCVCRVGVGGDEELQVWEKSCLGLQLSAANTPLQNIVTSVGTTLKTKYRDTWLGLGGVGAWNTVFARVISAPAYFAHPNF
jgi:hypothetical protein